MSGRGNTALTPEQIAELFRVHEIRSTTPSIQQLAERWGVSRQTLHKYLNVTPKRYR